MAALFDALGNFIGEDSVVTTTQSQATPPAPVNAPAQSQVNQSGQAPANYVAGATAPNQAGVGAPSEDAGVPTVSSISVGLNAATNPSSSNIITPQGNILDQFASYTYNIGWYLLTPDQFKAVSSSAAVNPTQWSLLVQSGGAAASQSGVSQTGGTGNQQAQAAVTSGRNKYFTNDYYLDDLEITSVLRLEGAGLNTALAFKVTEPNGLTLLPNLSMAVKDLYQDSSIANNNALYCLVIKFLGWDINGNLVTDYSDKATALAASKSSLNKVTLTRYYPFTIADMNFKVVNKAIEYEIKGLPHAFAYGTSSATASVPYDLELSGQTVAQILSGTGSTGTVLPTTDGRKSTPTPASTSTPIAVAVGSTGVAVGTPGAENQQQADTINLLAAGNMGA